MFCLYLVSLTRKDHFLQYLLRTHKFNTPLCVSTAENSTLEFESFASQELASTLTKGDLEWRSPNIFN